MHARSRPSLRLCDPVPAAASVAAAYNRAGGAYLAYADGDADRLFSFDGLHAYADRRLWALLAERLAALRACGAASVTLLDACCGPGTWLRRMVTEARRLGFSRITARGFDLAREQIEIARRTAKDLTMLPGVDLSFSVADLAESLPESDASVDITLCLYSVLSHLPAASLPPVLAELARVTRGDFIATVRSTGSTPTISVDSLDKARDMRLDHRLDRLDAELADGRRIAMGFHLFEASELRAALAETFTVVDLCGLDIFHSRFVPDVRWNPESLLAEGPLAGRLAELEESLARDVDFMARANHLLIVGRRKAPPIGSPRDECCAAPHFSLGR